MDSIKLRIEEMMRKWRSAESQQMMFGIDMIQTQIAVEDLLQSINEVFKAIPEFFLVEKEENIEPVIKNKPGSAEKFQSFNVSINLPLMPKAFRNLQLNSISLARGLKHQDLLSLFSGLSMKKEDVELLGGLKAILAKKGVKNIYIDQVKFQLLNEDESVGLKDQKKTSDAGGVGGHSPSIDQSAMLAAKEYEKKVKAKLFDSAWSEYFEGSIDRHDFKDEYNDLINEVINNPNQLVNILKSMADKQKEIEKFLANLEAKLFDLGFPDEAISALKEKLISPKQVLVSEDELARLRKIEKEAAKSADERIEASLKIIDGLKSKLSDRKERFDAILRQMGQGGVVLDDEGKIVALNPVAQKILGVSLNEARGKKVEELIRDHQMLSMVSNWQSETDENTPKQVIVKSSSEETKDIIRESSIVVEDESGKTIGTLSALQDITQQEEIQKRKNEILDVLGHDLRAPVCAIRQNFNMLIESANLKEKLDPQQEKFLNICLRNIERTEKLIAKILDVRQFEVGKVILKNSDVNMKILILDSIDSVDKWRQDKSIKIEADIQKLPDIYGDSERLYQVITNILSNALKFTGEGGKIIIQGDLVMLGDMQYAQIKIKDSGIGIKNEDLSRIFNRYEQISLENPVGVSGLGLGLAICKSIVSLHGGKIWAESEFGEGTTFIIQLPVWRNMEKTYD